MPQQTESATRTTLRKIDARLAGRKVRVAGRVLSYDVRTGLAVLIDGKHALLVDTLLCLDGEAKVWVTERLSKVMAIGLLERVDESAGSDIPAMPTNALRLTLNKTLVLRAILVVPVPDLDLALWNAIVDEDEEDEEERDE